MNNQKRKQSFPRASNDSRNGNSNYSRNGNSNYSRNGNSNNYLRKEYNPNNQLLTRKVIEDILKQVCGIKISVFDIKRYQLAFIHKSVWKRDLSPPKDVVLEAVARYKLSHPSFELIELMLWTEDQVRERLGIGVWKKGKPVTFNQNYEALEFTGDGHVGSIVGEYLFQRFPGQPEGFLTGLKQRIVCKDGLAFFSRHLNFKKYILLSNRAEQRIGREKTSLLEDVFEAFCAAIRQDLGGAFLNIFIKNIIESYVDFEDLIMNDTNYKGTLMRFFQENGWSTPTYAEIKKTGAGRNTLFTIGVNSCYDINRLKLPFLVMIDNKTYVSIATAKSKPDAQKLAAKLALERFHEYIMKHRR